MGYTHYITRKQINHDQTTWDKLIVDCKTLYKNMPEYSHSSGDYSGNDPLFLSGCYEHDKPQFTKSQVVFNGSNGLKRIKRIGPNDKGQKSIEWLDAKSDNDNLNNLGHETFVLCRKTWIQPDYRNDKQTLFSFCKTARKPYDLMVQACLILYKFYFKDDVSIFSDGDDEDWSEAFKFIATALPHGKEIGIEMLLESLDKTLFEKNIAL